MLIFYPTFISIPTVLSTTQIINREYLSKDRKMSTANSGQKYLLGSKHATSYWC